MKLYIAVIALILAGCSGGAGTSVPSHPATPAPVSTAFTPEAETSQQPISQDPLPASNGQTVNFAVCVPTYNVLAYTMYNGISSWVETGCTATAVAPNPGSGSWLINGQNASCILRYDQVSGDVILFECQGNPFA